MWAPPSSEETWGVEARVFCGLKEVWEAKWSGWDWNWEWRSPGYLVLERHVRRCRRGFLEWEFHVLFDKTYEVPVLYLRAFQLDGRAVSGLEIIDELNLDSAMVSVEDHPFTGEPYIFFHACSTQELLENVDSDVLSILTWFLIAGPSVGLRIDPRQWPSFLTHLRSHSDATTSLATLSHKARLWI